MGIDVIGATTNLVQTAGSLGNSFGSIPAGISVPAPNILSNYASYTYVIALHPLTVTELNFPDQSYLQGRVLPIICKSAFADPINRIQTPNFGKQDFFINNLTFETYLGHTSPKTTSVATIQFDVYEPYSIGLFINSLQAAANKAGYENWRDAPFLLSVEFRGNTEKGLMKKVPFSTRFIPVRFATIQMSSSEQGTRYMINAYATNGLALTNEFASLRTDLSIKGKTVQEVLQIGAESLQNVVNAKLYEAVDTGTKKIADQIVIVFPKDIADSKAFAQVNRADESTNTVVINPQAGPSAEILKKLGVTVDTLTQAAGDVNDIGTSSLGFNPERKSDQSPADAIDTWDPQLKIWLRGKLIPNWSEGTFKFNQQMDIPSVINQIIIASDYPKKALAQAENGLVTWWRIDTQIYYIETKENYADTGKMPKIAVYRVVPFKVHLSKAAGSGTNVDGIDLLKARAIKRYDYIFTGKNTEIIKFNIDYNVGFSNNYASDSFLNSIGVTRAKSETTGDRTPQANQQGSAPKAVVAFKPDGAAPSGDDKSAQRQQSREDATNNSMDQPGGNAAETAFTRLAKTFHEAITNPYDMVMLDMEIMGDPYWFATSGMGNYVAQPVTGFKDLHQDGSVSWQTSQVDVVVNFRTPVDINQTTGLYNFAGPNHMDMSKDPKAGPAIGFTGAYCVTLVKNFFRNGEFRQVLEGFRRGGQEYKTIAKKESTINSNNPPNSGQGGTS